MIIIDNVFGVWRAKWKTVRATKTIHNLNYIRKLIQPYALLYLHTSNCAATCNMIKSDLKTLNKQILVRWITFHAINFQFDISSNALKTRPVQSTTCTVWCVVDCTSLNTTLSLLKINPTGQISRMNPKKNRKNSPKGWSWRARTILESVDCDSRNDALDKLIPRSRLPERE
jgi:hypothetical protein